MLPGATASANRVRWAGGITAGLPPACARTSLGAYRPSVLQPSPPTSWTLPPLCHVQDRVGGRLQRARVGAGEHTAWADLGAQWVGGTQASPSSVAGMGSCAGWAFKVALARLPEVPLARACCMCARLFLTACLPLQQPPPPAPQPHPPHHHDHDHVPCATAHPAPLRFCTPLQDRVLALMEDFDVSKFPTPAPPGEVLQWRGVGGKGGPQEPSEEEAADYQEVGGHPWGKGWGKDRER